MKKEYKEEVENRWGNTEEYKENSEKMEEYSEEDLNLINAELRQIFADFALCRKNGDKVTSPKVQSLVEKLHNHISKYHFKCSKKVFLAIGDMYVYDERFQEFIDKSGENTAIYISLAIEVYCKE